MLVSKKTSLYCRVYVFWLLMKFWCT